MICFMRLLVSIFLENNRITQNLIWFVPFGCCYQFLLETTAWHKTWYDLCRLVVAGHTPRKQPNDTKYYMICVIRLLLSIFIANNRMTQNIIWFVSFGCCYFSWKQMHGTKSNMICVIWFLLFMWVGSNRMTQNPIWFVSFGCRYPFFLRTTEWHKI